MLHRRTLTGTGIAIVLSIAAAGCAGNGHGLDANGQPLVPGGGGDQPLTADFDSIQAHVFTPICTACHAGATAPHGLRLDAADSYHLLVNVPSDEVPGILRVRPGDPDNSYVIQKLEGHAAVGARMPFGGPYLATDVIAAIRQWISNGAAPSASAAAAAAAAPFAVTAVAPAGGETLAVAPPQVMVAFSRELDLTRVGPDAVRIERFTADAGVQAAVAVPADVTAPAADAHALLLRPLQALPPGHYRVVLSQHDSSRLTDIGGAPPLVPAAGGDDGGSDRDAAGADGDAVLSRFDVGDAR